VSLNQRIKAWVTGKPVMLTEAEANAIYDILIQECGATEICGIVPTSEREHFVERQMAEEIREWRFCGWLGFGGKFWRNSGRMYVTCYSEDETPKRKAMIESANKRLEAL